MWAYIIAISSSSVHLSFLISGFKWLCHLSLHCLPILPGKFLAIKLQFLGPCSPTRRITSSSYSRVWWYRKNYPGAFYEFRVEDFLPSVEALDVSSFLKKSGNAFPIPGSMLIDQLLQFLVFLLSPPPLLHVSILLRVIRIDHLQFGDDVIE